MSAHLLLAQILLIFAAAFSGLAAGQIMYGCSGSGFSQRRLTNYGKYTFILYALPPNSSFLQPNMDCTISIIGYSTSQWIVTLNNVSLGAYEGEFNVYEGETSGGKNLIALKSVGTLYRQFGISTGSFTVRQTTKAGPANIAYGVQMTVEHLETTACPSGWYTVSSSAGYCYGVPRMAANLGYDLSTKACNMMLANLIMGNFDYDSISTELLTAPTSVVDPRLAYWVGMYEKNDEFKFLNKYTSLDSLSGRLCSQSSTNCKCITYQGGRFFKDDCSSQHQYVCYMPRGGTSSYYNIDSLINTTSSIITIIAIVLTVGFILTVIVSLIIVFVCCIRQSRRNRRRSTNATANTGAANTGAGGAFVIGGTAGAPPPYPTAGMYPPPPPPFSTLPAAPPYTANATTYATYSNLGFDTAAGSGAATSTAAASNIDAAEKPPPYNPDWSGHNVPA